MAKQITPISDELTSQHSQAIFRQPLESVEPLNELTRGQYAKNTLVSFKNDWNSFLAFCIEHKVPALPAKADTVHRYIEQMAKTRKLASLKRYLVTLSLVHRCHTLPDPCAQTEIRLEMKKQQLEKHDDYQNASAFRDEHLQSLLLRFELSTKPKDIRDLAIWAVMFEAMLKRSELANLSVENLSIHPNGMIDLCIKNDVIALSSVASKALQRWLVTGMIDNGFVFRRIDRHGNIGDSPLDHSSIYRVFRRASDELGQPESSLFSGQSPRVGASQDLAESGCSIKDIQEQGRWKSPAMPAQYVGNKDRHDKEIAKYIKPKPWER
ncbi:integrase [Photobacterium ganghwense]|uniref:Integrase n=1 Tax=Photobacterium ganghwense TaxID=320778 RepID=A0A0J1H832_9GAMM|nr:tyrosine-type recombinase/integrase [Photobacterium ganghwense]KLV07853.1 integrase [Photobacterium ganghwense]PSU06946.1 integrase [Photobacterium ganghwense]QSV15698.1 tyrosine-type recombinase/integrase [Photobacterium ganghwense]